jgi:2-polyprenyl-6-methoxyphenol hydroxylase-like FAD-dependent oxidoreductase
MPGDDPQVLIVGGGPVGLTLAIELGQQGVSCELIDKRPAPGRLPKMERCNARTMENFRQAGIADRIRAAGLDSDAPMDVFICAGTLTRPPLVHHPYPSVNELKALGRTVSDCSMPLEPYQLISQYTLEPVLREVAENTPGVTVRFGHELIDFTERGGGVTALVRVNTASGGEDSDPARREVRAQYIVGCDGGGSTVRQALGVELRGESLLELRQALFYCADLYERIPIGKGRHYHFADDKSTFLIVQDDRKHFSLHARVGDDAEMPKLFAEIAGMPVDFETLYVGTWIQRLMLADRYRVGRAFLAGDSAHLVIPTGGLGMNTGAADAVDLAWKLSGTLHGWGGPALLDSYEQERRPIGGRNVAASRKAATGRRAWRAAWDPAIADDTPQGEAARARLTEIAEREQRWSNDLLGIELGYRYDGSPLIAREPGDPPDADSFDYTPSTWPGTRVPHIWLRDGSALADRLGRGYTLLHTRPLTAADASLVQAFERLGAPFTTLRFDAETTGTPFEGYPLLLIRPDLHIVWRGRGPASDPGALAAIATGHARQREGSSGE